LKDNTRAWELDANSQWTLTQPKENEEKFMAQKYLITQREIKTKS
jgi:polyphosphate kinase